MLCRSLIRINKAILPEIHLYTRLLGRRFERGFQFIHDLSSPHVSSSFWLPPPREAQAIMAPKASSKTEQKAKAKIIEDKTCQCRRGGLPGFPSFRFRSPPSRLTFGPLFTLSSNTNGLAGPTFYVFMNYIVDLLCRCHLSDALLRRAVGLKNKNKSAKVAKYVQQVQTQVNQMGNRKAQVRVSSMDL